MAVCDCLFFQRMVEGGVNWHCNDCVLTCIDEQAKADFLAKEAKEQEEKIQREERIKKYKEYLAEHFPGYDPEKAKEDAQKQTSYESTVLDLRDVLDFLVKEGMEDYTVSCSDYDGIITVKSIEDVGINESRKEVYV